ncbi:MAG: hypothetical protein QOJ40_2494 [Verrucomicrobiota bacterium]
MNENENDSPGFNRRDFLKSSSVTTLMTMLGGVELFAPAAEAAEEPTKYSGPKTKVAVIGLGAWGRELINTLAVLPQAEVAAICDNYPSALKRIASSAPGAAQTEDYKTILDNKDIKAVFIATPTHLHKEIALDALKAGKHVYCEAPLANTIEDARAIASAAKAATQVIFQSGLQMRAEPQRQFLVPFIRSGAIGQPIMATAQWHRKQSWRAAAANPEREKALNWRLSKETSLGLVGDVGCHQIDQVNWFLNQHPVAVTGLGSVAFWKDGRDVPDTIQAVLEYPGGVNLVYNGTLANSFDADYEMLYGSDAALMTRESKEHEKKAWLFKEVDSPMLGWEIYATKNNFYQETGIVLAANATKSVKAEKSSDASPFENTTIAHALETFVRNAADIEIALADARENFKDDPEAIKDQLSQVKRRPAAGFLEGFQATVLVIKANEAIRGGKRIEIKSDLFELS